MFVVDEGLGDVTMVKLLRFHCQITKTDIVLVNQWTCNFGKTSKQCQYSVINV